jgi:hypothetical protein
MIELDHFKHNTTTQFKTYFHCGPLENTQKQNIHKIINRVVCVLDVDWLKAVVYLSNKARGGWYMANILQLRAFLRHNVACLDYNP